MTYTVNEMFYAPQGEGARVGQMSVFVRFAACNLTCSVESVGFDCDTDFSGGRKMTADEIVHVAKALAPHPVDHDRWVVLTGGEPALQIDVELIDALKAAKFRVAIETNGTHPIPRAALDFVCVSPKTAEHTLRIGDPIDELRYVRANRQALPKPRLKATHYWISPAFNADGQLERDTLQWCLRLIEENPKWKLSLQTHKIIGAR